jgi:nucleotide-binding universal stress UspA family protein
MASDVLSRTAEPMKSQQDEVFAEFAREFIRRHRPAHPPWPVERILVATDFSLCSLNALERAEELARKLDAELILLHVEAVPVAGSQMADATHAAVGRELAHAADQLRHHHHLKVRSLLRTGAADEEILDAAETERASLIVMGTHGRKGVARVLLGSVAERVLRGARCPVLTVGLRRDG